MPGGEFGSLRANGHSDTAITTPAPVRLIGRTGAEVHRTQNTVGIKTALSKPENSDS